MNWFVSTHSEYKYGIILIVLRRSFVTASFITAGHPASIDRSEPASTSSARPPKASFVTTHLS